MKKQYPKQYSTIGMMAAVIFVAVAIILVGASISGLIKGDMSLYDLGLAHGLIGLAVAFLGMAKVSFLRLIDGVDTLIAIIVNGLFGMGHFFLVLASAGAVEFFPEKYEWGFALIVGVMGLFMAVMAPLLYNRMTNAIIVDESKRPQLSTAAILSLILFSNLLSIIVFHAWVLFFR